MIKGLFEVAIQAVIIGFITFIPRYGDRELLLKIGGSNGYVLVFISMIVALVVLIIARGRLISQKP